MATKLKKRGRTAKEWKKVGKKGRRRGGETKKVKKRCGLRGDNKKNQGVSVSKGRKKGRKNRRNGKGKTRNFDPVKGKKKKCQ